MRSAAIFIFNLQWVLSHKSHLLTRLFFAQEFSDPSFYFLPSHALSLSREIKVIGEYLRKLQLHSNKRYSVTYLFLLLRVILWMNKGTLNAKTY